MRISLKKFRSLVLRMGKLVQHKFSVDGEEILTVQDQPMKSLGRWYDTSLTDMARKEELNSQVIEGLQVIESSWLPGTFKVWVATWDTFG